MRRPAAPATRQNPCRQASAVATTHISPEAKAGRVGPLRKQPEIRDEQVSLHLPCRRSARAAAHGAREPFCGNAFANASGAEVADGRRSDRRPQTGGRRMRSCARGAVSAVVWSSLDRPARTIPALHQRALFSITSRKGLGPPPSRPRRNDRRRCDSSERGARCAVSCALAADRGPCAG